MALFRISSAKAFSLAVFKNQNFFPILIFSCSSFFSGYSSIISSTLISLAKFQKHLARIDSSSLSLSLIDFCETLKDGSCN